MGGSSTLILTLWNWYYDPHILPHFPILWTSYWRSLCFRWQLMEFIQRAQWGGPASLRWPCLSEVALPQWGGPASVRWPCLSEVALPQWGGPASVRAEDYRLLLCCFSLCVVVCNCSLIKGLIIQQTSWQPPLQVAVCSSRAHVSYMLRSTDKVIMDYWFIVIGRWGPQHYSFPHDSNMDSSGLWPLCKQYDTILLW